MLKEIEIATIKIIRAMEKNRIAYVEAEEWYRDTGYDRYLKKMNKLEAEYDELKTFLGLDKQDKENELEAENARLYSENKELKNFIKDAKSQMDYIKAEYWSDPKIVRLHERFKDFNSLN